jgi:hypothetical protein
VSRTIAHPGRRCGQRRSDYNGKMKAAVLSFLALSLCLAAQSVDGGDAAATQGLKSDLQSLRTSGAQAETMSRQVGMHMLLLAEKTHEPKAPTLQRFSESLVGALAGHAVMQEDIDRLAGDIAQTMQSAGTSTIGFEETVKDFEKRLMRAGVQAIRAHLVASNLERVGREVRGPEGFPAR